MAKKYDGRPVLFIAVNSGTSRNEVERYASSVGLDWPIIVDMDRSFEQQSQVGTISLSNIHWAQVITADGKWLNGEQEDLQPAVEKALAGATWKVDPGEIPTPLHDARLAVEFGNYAAAAATINRGLGSPKPDIKSGAETLQAFVQKEIDTGAKYVTSDLERGTSGKPTSGAKTWPSGSAATICPPTW